MDIFLHKLAAQLKSRGIGEDAQIKMHEIHHDQDKNVYQCDFKYKNLYFSIHPVDDENRLLNIYWQRDKSTLEPLTHVSQELAMEFIRSQVEQADRPSYKDKAHGKALEHYDRIDADENELSEEKLDALIKKLELGMYNGEMKEPDTDEMTDSPESNKNVVKTFPTDSKLELSSMPHKVYNKGGELPKNVPKDGIVKCKGADTEDLPTKAEDEEDLWEKERDADGVPQRLNENLKGKVLVYDKNLGAIFVDKKLYEQYKQEKGTKFGIGERGEVILMKEGQTNNNKFVPINLRRL